MIHMFAVFTAKLKKKKALNDWERSYVGGRKFISSDEITGLPGNGRPRQKAGSGESEIIIHIAYLGRIYGYALRGSARSHIE